MSNKANYTSSMVKTNISDKANYSSSKVKTVISNKAKTGKSNKANTNTNNGRGLHQDHHFEHEIINVLTC